MGKFQKIVATPNPSDLIDEGSAMRCRRVLAGDVSDRVSFLFIIPPP
jgi:hypothetical protein